MIPHDEPAEGGNRIRWFRVQHERGQDGLIYHDEGLDLWFWRTQDQGKL